MVIPIAGISNVHILVSVRRRVETPMNRSFQNLQRHSCQTNQLNQSWIAAQQSAPVRPVNPTLPRPVDPTLPRPVNPTLLRPVNPTLLRPVNPTLPRPVDPTLPRPPDPIFLRPIDPVSLRSDNLTNQSRTSSSRVVRKRKLLDSSDLFHEDDDWQVMNDQNEFLQK